MAEQDQRPTVSVPQIAGSALAAVSSTVALSFLGVAGTLIGAALGSIIITVGNTIYSHYFDRTGKIVKAKTEVLRKVDSTSVDRTAKATMMIQVSAADTSGIDGAKNAEGADVGAEAGRGWSTLEADSATEVGPTTEVTAGASTAEAGTAAAGAADEGDAATAATDDVASTRTHAAEAPAARGRLWRRPVVLRLAVLTVAVFGFFLLGITAFEVINGRTMSAVVREDPRSSRPSLLGGGSSSEVAPESEQEGERGAVVDDEPVPTSEPMQEPTDAPAQEPTDPATSTAEVATPGVPQNELTEDAGPTSTTRERPSPEPTAPESTSEETEDDGASPPEPPAPQPTAEQQPEYGAEVPPP